MSSHRTDARWRVPLGLAVVLLAAALFRALYVYAYSRTGILFDGMMLDAQIYDDWGQRIAGGDWMGHEAFYFAPLYPYLIGVLYALFGHSYGVVYLMQGLLGLLSIALVHRIALTLYGSRAALYAAAGAALFAPFSFFETKILGTTLGLSLGLLALWLLVRAEIAESPERPAARRRGGTAGPQAATRWLAAGAVIGVTALSAPSFLLLAMLYAAALAWRRRFVATVALLAGAAIAVSPALVHNLVVAGDWLPISGQGGITFYQGNNPSAVGIYAPVPGFTGAPDRQAAEEQALAQRETGRTLKRSEVSAHFFQKGLDFVLGSPGPWLLLEGQKAGRLLGTYEASTEYSLYQERERIRLLWIGFLPFAAILAAASGLLVSRLRRKAPDENDPDGEGKEDSDENGASPEATAGRRALLLYTIYATAVPLLFYVSSRYRLPLVPALLIYGGAFVDRMASQIRESGRLDDAAARGAAAGLVAGLVSFFPLGRPAVSVEANVHYNLARILSERGDNESAVAELNRCLGDWPDHPYALVNLGNSFDRLGRTDEALASYRRAQEMRPGFWTAYSAEGTILFRLKQYDDAVDAYTRGAEAGGSEAWFLIGTVREAQGQLDEAEKALREAIRLRGGDPRYYNTLGLVLQKRGQNDDAIQAYLHANQLDARYEKSRYNLGNLYLSRQKVDEAQAQFEEALRIAPDYLRARLRLGDVLAQRGNETQAIREWNAVIKANPEDAAAKSALSRLKQKGH